MITTILFDFGGVISDVGTQKRWAELNYEKYGKSVDEIMDMIVAEWSLAKVNTISSQEYWQNLAKKLDSDPKEIRASIASSFHINHETVKLIDQLSSSGIYTLVLVSNHIEDWLEEVLDQNDLRKYFDYNLSSYIARLAKPDAAYFEYVARETGMSFSEMVLIDDQQKNIDGAEVVGIEALLFKDNKQLLTDLAALGIVTGS